MEIKKKSKIKRMLREIGGLLCELTGGVFNAVCVVGLVVMVYALKFAIPVAVILILLRVFGVI